MLSTPWKDWGQPVEITPEKWETRFKACRAAMQVHPELPVYVNDAARLLVHWDHEPRMPWQTEARTLTGL